MKIRKKIRFACSFIKLGAMGLAIDVLMRILSAVERESIKIVRAKAQRARETEQRQ